MKRIQIAWIVTMLLVAPLIVRAQSKPLPETYVSEDERMTLRYPTGWVIEANQPGSIIVSTSYDIKGDTLPPGEAFISIGFINDEQGYFRDYLASDDLVGMMNGFIDSVLNGAADLQVEFNTPSSTTFAGFSAVRSDGSLLDSHIFIIMAERDDDMFNIVIGGTSAAEFNKFEPKLLAIAESAQYVPPTISQ